MKKFLGLLTISANCLAMTFSQPVKTGFSVSYSQVGGAGVTNATENNGDFYRRKYNGKTIIYDGSGKNGSVSYGKGVARWGNGIDSLYAHYNAYNTMNDSNIYFGDKNIKNTVPINSVVFGEEIFKIGSDTGITFYMIHTSYDLPDETWWTLIGRRKDGVWVKYFDSDSVTEKYFGKQGNIWKGKSICCDNFRVSDNTIVIEYSRYYKNVGNHNEFIKEGEFRFKWDDKAQWFSMEQVIY